MNNSHENVKLSSCGNLVSSSIIVGSSRSSTTSVSESPTSNTLYENWVTSFPSQCLQDETQYSAIQESSIATSSTNELLNVPPAPLRAIPPPPINTISIQMPLTMQPPSSYFSLNSKQSIMQPHMPSLISLLDLDTTVPSRMINHAFISNGEPTRAKITQEGLATNWSVNKIAQPSFSARPPQMFQSRPPSIFQPKKQQRNKINYTTKSWFLPENQPPPLRSSIKRLGPGEKAMVIRERDLYRAPILPNDKYLLEPEEHINLLTRDNEPLEDRQMENWEKVQAEINSLLAQEKTQTNSLDKPEKEQISKIKSSRNIESLESIEGSPTYEKFLEENIHIEASTSTDTLSTESEIWRKVVYGNVSTLINTTSFAVPETVEDVAETSMREESEVRREEETNMVDKLSDIAFDIPLLKAIRSQIEQREESSKRFQASETRTFERPTSKLVNPAAATPPSELEQERIPEAPTTSNHDEADGLTVPDNWVSLAEPEDDVVPEPSTSSSTLSFTVTFNPAVSQKQVTSQKSQRNSSSSKIGSNPKKPTRRPKTLPSKSKMVANIQIQTAHTPIKIELNLPSTSSIRSDMLDKPESKKKPKTSAKKQSHAASKSSESSARQSPKHQGPVEIPNEEKILEYFGVSNRVQLMNLKQFKFLTPEQMKDVSGELLVQLRNLYGSYRVACLTYMQNAIFQLPPNTFNVSALFSIWKNVGTISKNPEVETIFENIPDTSCVVCGSKKNNNQLGKKKSHVFSESHVKNHFEKYGTEPPEVITFLKFVKEENKKLSSQNIQVPQTLSIPQFPDAGPLNPSFFALPSLENIEVDSKILNHFQVSTKGELFALPQFSQPYVSDEKEFDQVLETQFVKYRDVCVHYLKNTMLSLPSENFHVWPLFKVYLGVQKNIETRFLQYHHEGLKAIVQEAPQICRNCDDKTRNVKIGLRAVHIFSPSHIIQHLQRTSTEPPEILAYLKIVSENAKSFNKIQEFSALQAAAKQKTIVEQRLMALVSGKESTRKRKRKKKVNDNKETSKRVKK